MIFIFETFKYHVLFMGYTSDLCHGILNACYDMLYDDDFYIL
jgi:hypothetical protein